MIESHILEQLQKAPLEERIAIIEMLLRSLKNEVGQSAQTTLEPNQNPPGYRFMVEDNEIHEDTILPMPEFGSAKGLIKMSDDFDEPLEDFAEYAP